jgi:hypothetical protein
LTLDVKPEIAAALEALASAKGLSVEDYLKELVDREMPLQAEENGPADGSGMVWEGGLFVYRTGRPLPSEVVDHSVEEIREVRLRRLLGHNS